MRYIYSAFSLIHVYYPYILKPALWREIWRREICPRMLKLNGKYVAPEVYPNDSGWCSRVAVSTRDALDALGFELKDLQGLCSETFDQATRTARDCPIKMGGAGNLKLLYSLAEGLEAKRVVETGVAYGWSSLAILLSLQRRNGRLCSVDLPYFKLRSDKWVGCVVPQDLRSHWRLYCCADQEGLPRAIAAVGLIDLAHYDSDKSYDGRLRGYKLMWENLRSGGILLSDDIGDNAGFQDFSKSIGLLPIVVADNGKYQGILQKP